MKSTLVFLIVSLLGSLVVQKVESRPVQFSENANLLVPPEADVPQNLQQQWYFQNLGVRVQQAVQRFFQPHVPQLDPGFVLPHPAVGLPGQRTLNGNNVDAPRDDLNNNRSEEGRAPDLNYDVRVPGNLRAIRANNSDIDDNAQDGFPRPFLAFNGRLVIPPTGDQAVQGQAARPFEPNDYDRTENEHPVGSPFGDEQDDGGVNDRMMK